MHKYTYTYYIKISIVSFGCILPNYLHNEKIYIVDIYCSATSAYCSHLTTTHHHVVSNRLSVELVTIR